MQLMLFCMIWLVKDLLAFKKLASAQFNHCNNQNLLQLFRKPLTHIGLASFLWDIGKQCRPKSDAYRMLY